MNVGRILGVAILAIFVQWLLIQDLAINGIRQPPISICGHSL